MSNHWLAFFAIAFALLFLFEKRQERRVPLRLMAAYWMFFAFLNPFVDLSPAYLVQSVLPFVDLSMVLAMILIHTRYALIQSALLSVMAASGFLVMWEPVYENYESIVYCVSTAMLMISCDGIFDKVRIGSAGIAGDRTSSKPRFARILLRKAQK